jgi:hypothetical protein
MLGAWKAVTGAERLNTEGSLGLAGGKLFNGADKAGDGFSEVGAVVTGVSAFWLDCGGLGLSKMEPGAGNWLAAACEGPELSLTFFAGKGEKGCPEVDGIFGTLNCASVSGALKAGNRDGVPEVVVFPGAEAGKDC